MPKGVSPQNFWILFAYLTSTFHLQDSQRDRHVPCAHVKGTGMTYLLRLFFFFPILNANFHTFHNNRTRSIRKQKLSTKLAIKLVMHS